MTQNNNENEPTITYYQTEDFTFNCLLYNIEDYLKENKNNDIDNNILNIFNGIITLFNDKEVDKHTLEVENNIYNIMDSMGYYNDVIEFLKKGGII